jgi:hypothetical protein
MPERFPKTPEDTRRTRRTWTGGALVLALVLSLRAFAGTECAAVWGDGRALVDVTVRDLVGRDFERLLKLGLAGNLRLDVTLFRVRAFWLDEAKGRSRHTFSLSYSKKTGHYSLGERPVADPSVLALPRFSVSVEGNPDQARYRVEVHARLQVVTPDGLQQVVSWGSDDSAPGPILAALAEGLVREESAHCNVEPKKP